MGDAGLLVAEMEAVGEGVHGVKEVLLLKRALLL